MGDESAKRAAQEYLAARLSAEGQSEQARLNRETAERLAQSLWSSVADQVHKKCREWNSIAQEQTFNCRETIVGDLRILCTARPGQQLIVHFDSQKLLITFKNSARLEHETDSILLMEGYATATWRDVRLMNNNGEPANLDMLLVGELRVLAGMSRRA